MKTVRIGDHVSVEITEVIREAAVKFLAAIVTEIRTTMPGATFNDLTRVSINVALAYLEQQSAEVIRFPFHPQSER